MRTRRPPLKLARDRLSTIAWIHAVRAAAAINDGVPPGIDPLGLQKALVRKRPKKFGSFHRSHRIRSYFDGTTTPGSSTLNLFEGVYPGTLEVFRHGPDHSHLWDAIFRRDPETAKSVFFDLKHDIQQGVRAEISIRRRRRRGSKLPKLEIVPVLIPDSLARGFRASKSARVDAVNAALASRLKRNPKLSESFSTFLVGGGPFDVDGPVVQVVPDVTFSAKARRGPSAFVRPSYLAGFALQVLHARINEQSTVTLSGWDIFFITSRLHDFGLDADEFERVSGLRVRASRPTKAEIAVIRHSREMAKKIEPRTNSSAVSKS